MRWRDPSRLGCCLISTLSTAEASAGALSPWLRRWLVPLWSVGHPEAVVDVAHERCPTRVAMRVAGRAVIEVARAVRSGIATAIRVRRWCWHGPETTRQHHSGRSEQ